LGAAILALTVSCGETTPGGASAPIAGRYQLVVLPSSSCLFPILSLSFDLDVVPAGNSPHPGVQGLRLNWIQVDPADDKTKQADGFEAELVHESGRLRGGVGTPARGGLAKALGGGQLLVWLHLIVEADVSTSMKGRGEVASGTAMGSISYGFPGDAEVLFACDAVDHRFALKALEAQ